MKEIIEYCCYRISKFYLWAGETWIYPIRGPICLFGAFFFNLDVLFRILGLCSKTLINLLIAVWLFLSIFLGTEKNYQAAEKKFKNKRLISGWVIVLYLTISYVGGVLYIFTH